MTTNSHGPWTDWAVLEPSTPQFDKHGQPVKYRVQRNAEGTWRCYCKSFIFSGRGGAVKTCKHIRHCQHLDNGNTPVTMTTATVKPVVQKHPQWDSAYAICVAMLDQARLSVNVNDKQRDQMVEVLAKKLATFTPARVIAPALPPQVLTAGVRHITFDD